MNKETISTSTKSFEGRHNFISLLENTLQEAFNYAHDLKYLEQYTMTMTESILISSIKMNAKALAAVMKDTEKFMTNG